MESKKVGCMDVEIRMVVKGPGVEAMGTNF